MEYPGDAVPSLGGRYSLQHPVRLPQRPSDWMTRRKSGRNSESGESTPTGEEIVSETFTPSQVERTAEGRERGEDGDDVVGAPVGVSETRTRSPRRLRSRTVARQIRTDRRVQFSSYVVMIK